MNKNWDFTLQVLFIFGLAFLALVFYLTRLAPLRAGNENSGIVDPYSQFNSVYQFEQEERRLETSIKVGKADYASDLAVFLWEKERLETAVELSELEKREKLSVLMDLYSDYYFQRKLDLIDQDNLELERLRELKCLRYCTYQDLPGDL